jgi:mRNA-degrading endonuclease RelE of RelBE toxin-antitoxin system
MPRSVSGRMPEPPIPPRFALVCHPKVEHDLQAIGDSATLTQMVVEILALQHDSLPAGFIRMHGLKQVWFRIRVGDYRAVYQVNGDTIYVALVGNRKEIYKQLKWRFPKASVEPRGVTLLCYRGHLYQRKR